MRSLFNFMKNTEPIKYETSKVLPFAQEKFFEVVKNVDDYEKFIPWITRSKIHPHTVQENFEAGVRRGRFEAETKIGFSSVNFAYKSHVTYETPYSLLSIAEDTRIFQGLHSHWEIIKLEEDACEIVYKIRM